MKSLLEYKNLIMSTGLIPAIVCMIFCIFFQDAVVLYACLSAKPSITTWNFGINHCIHHKRYKRRYAYSGPNSSHYARNTDTLFFTTLSHGPQFLYKTILLLSL